MKSKEEIKELAESIYGKGKVENYEEGFVDGYSQYQEDRVDKDKWTFEEILDACYPTLGRGSDWCEIVKRLKEQKLNKQD